MNARLTCAVLALLAVGCSRDGGSPTDPSQVSIEFTTTDITVGAGPEVVAGNVARVNYTVWLYNGNGVESKGQQLDTSVRPDGTPITLTVGRGQYIRGFEQGLLGMRAGGKRRVYVPASMAYGSAGRENIPPNAALVFELDLLSVQ